MMIDFEIATMVSFTVSILHGEEILKVHYLVKRIFYFDLGRPVRCAAPSLRVVFEYLRFFPS